MKVFLNFLRVLERLNILHYLFIDFFYFILIFILNQDVTMHLLLTWNHSSPRWPRNHRDPLVSTSTVQRLTAGTTTTPSLNGISLDIIQVLFIV